VSSAGRLGNIAGTNAATAFNQSCKIFLSNLLNLFPHDIILEQMIVGIDASMRDLPDRPAAVPALLFFHEISTIVQLDDGHSAPISELVMKEDERLVRGRYPIQILNMLKFSERYPLLNSKNRRYIWDTLKQLLQLSAIVTLAGSKDGGVIDEFVGAIMESGRSAVSSSGHSAKKVSPQALGKMIAKNKNVQEATRKFAEVTLGTTDSSGKPISAEQIATTANNLLSSGQTYANSIAGGQRVMAAGRASRKGMPDIRADNARERLRAKLERRKNTRSGETDEFF
jgi:hypothetical protein